MFHVVIRSGTLNKLGSKMYMLCRRGECNLQDLWDSSSIQLRTGNSPLHVAVRVQRLEFLPGTNAKDKDTAQEAKAAGHEAITVWVEGLIQRQDPARRLEDLKKVRQ